ncbi:hypothetical protein [Flavobacterium sp. JP2137]|uniref:hypothetical protein n=1 Tax=Flavobacterium sp. JP2137 TaxID=3414510 RepID=UPI003D2FF2BD
MKHFNKVLLGITLFLSAFSTKAQETTIPAVKNPPIFMETFAGDRALAYQMIINKKLQSIPKLGFFGVTNIQAEWGEPKVNDYMVQGNLTYSIVRGIDLSSGFIWNPIDGIRPSAGAIFSYGNPKLLAVVNPRVDLSKNANFDALALVEYKPAINEKLNLYTRLQGLYTHNLGYDFHTRSYVMLRAGLTYKDISFGAAANFDWYGPMKINENNFGGFVAVNLF